MTYQQARENLPLYVDGELDSHVAADVKAALDESAELRGELEHWRGLRQCAHRVVTAPALPSGLEDAIRQQTRREEQRRRYWRPLGWLGGVSAIAAAVVLGVFMWSSTETGEAGTAMVTAHNFAEIYLGCACSGKPCRRHVDLNLDDLKEARATLVAQAELPVLLPDLRSRGFRLAGACRCFHAEGVHVVHAFYQRDEGEKPTIVSLFSIDQKVCLANCRKCPCGRGLPGDYESATTENVTVYKWDAQNNSFAVCSDMPSEQLHELANGIQLASLQLFAPAFARAN